MRQVRLKMLALPLLVLLTIFVAIALPVAVYADNASIGAACAGLDQLPDGSCSSNGSDAINIISNGVKLLSILAGIITVIMLIVSGFQYITSGGDAGKVTKAKTSLVYSIIGLAVVALSQFLVHFVLSNAT